MIKIENERWEHLDVQELFVRNKKLIQWLLLGIIHRELWPNDLIQTDLKIIDFKKY